ncbi:MAG: hypothetical protein IJ042_09740 [Butyricicoccus sp.]|nr:hypothetical protein [Butyricicoccus sp.]
MSYARGHSSIARKERAWARKRPGTLTGTLQYLARTHDQKRQARKKKLAWIDAVVQELHAEQQVPATAK